MRRFAAFALAAIVLALLVSPAAAGTASPSGPDLSSHQHPNGAQIDWSPLSQAGTSFVFVKATEGTTYTNPYFAADYGQAASHGLIRAAYHYARPALPVSDAVAEADHFLAVAGAAKQRGELPLVLDLEESGGLRPADLVSWTQTFVRRVATASGRPPMIYTYPYFWAHAMGGSTAFHANPLWIADYRSHSGPVLPLAGGWGTWTFWQYTSTGRRAGIPAIVDLNAFNGDRAALEQLATPPLVPAAGTPGGLLAPVEKLLQQLEQPLPGLPKLLPLSARR